MGTVHKINCGVGFGLFVLLNALPAFAANEIQPGLWQDAETAEINGKVYPPAVMTGCIKPEDAKDIVKTAQAQIKASIMKDQPQECSKPDIRQTDDLILFEMKCGDSKQGAIDVSMTMTLTVNSPQSTTRVLKSTMSTDGRATVTSAKTELKWISLNCDKK